MRSRGLLLLAVLLPGVGRGEADPDEVPTTVVTATRTPPDPYAQPRAVGFVTAAELARRPARSTPEALLEEEGVFLQKTNHGGGAPIIRGLLGQQVLLTVDGVRLNNATVRSGPNQLLNTVDPFIIEQLEVLRGPGSVLYGSDALGGVVNVRTFWPRYAGERTPSAKLVLQGGTADASLQGHLRAGMSFEDSAVSAALTGRDFNDLRGGARVGVQPYTAYEEGDATLKVRHRLSRDTQLYLQYQAVRQTNAPRLDRSAPGDFRRFSGQERDFAHARLQGRDLGPFERTELEFSLHRQADLTDRFRIARDRLERDLAEVWTAGVRAQGEAPLRLFGTSGLILGADGFYDRVGSSFERQGIVDTAAVFDRPEDARYPGVPASLATGVFALLSGDERRAFTWRGGVRAQFNVTHLPEDSRLNALFASASSPPPVFPSSDEGTLGLAAELGVRQTLAEGLSAMVNLGTGFRSPNVDDYLRMGPEGPGFVVPGGAGLRAEQSYSAEAGARFVRGPLKTQAFYSYTTIPGLVGNMPTQVDGAATNPDGLPYLTRQNRDSARIHAVEGSASFQPHSTLTLSAHLTWTRGDQTRRDLTVPGQPLIDEPLSRAPPLNGAARVTFEPAEWVFFEGASRWAGPQARLSAADRLDVRMCPESPGCQGTPGYAVFHLRAGARYRRFAAAVTLQNLLDASYRAHGSGVDEPGRSLVLSLEGAL